MAFRGNTSLNAETRDYGKVELTIELAGIDSFLVEGYSIDLERELTDDELDQLNEELRGEIEFKAYLEAGNYD